MRQLQIQGPGAAGGIESPGVLVHARHHHRHLQQRLQIRIALRQIRSGSDNKRNASTSSASEPLYVFELVQRSFSFKAHVLALSTQEALENEKQSVAETPPQRFNARR